MRPLDKGLCPIDPKTGNDKVVTDYRSWRMDLINRIGAYCAYCNMPINHTPQVEHVVPKNPRIGQPVGNWIAWDNMLLACVACNGSGAKGNKPYNPTDYYTPENHNTLLAFSIEIHPSEPDASIVVPCSGLNVVQRVKAQNTIDLFKWQNIDRRDNVVDLRWKKRREAMNAVESNFDLFRQAKGSVTFDASKAAIAIAQMAKGFGFFNLWFNVFSGEPQVMEKLLDLNIIPGTAQLCFDRQNGFRSMHRNSNNLADPI